MVAAGRRICVISPGHQRGSSAQVRAVVVTAVRAVVGAPMSSRITTVLLSTQTAAIAVQAMAKERVFEELPGVRVKAYSCAAIQALRIQCVAGAAAPFRPLSPPEEPKGSTDFTPGKDF